MEALNVSRERFDILVAQFRGNGAHDPRVAVVAAITFAERRELFLDVVGVLPTQVRKTCCCNPRTVWRMAAGAGRHALIELAKAKQRFTKRDEIGIGSADAAFLTGVVSGDVCQVLVAERIKLPSHFQHNPFAVLDVMQLAEQIALTLAGELWEDGDQAIAVRAMASAADRCFRLAGDRIARWRVSGLHDAIQAQGQQQARQKCVHGLIRCG